MQELILFFVVIGNKIVAELVRAGYGWNLPTLIQVVGVSSALVGNRLINRMDIRGQYLWVVSNIILTGVHISASLYLPAVLQFCFLLMTFDGIRLWRKKAQAAAIAPAASLQS